MFAMYLIGIVTAVFVAWVLKSTLLAGDTPPFVMELPPYKTPSAGNVVLRMGERAWSFLYRAGTLILAVSVIVWALSYFPRDKEAVEGPHRARVAQLESTIAQYKSIAKDRRSEGEQKFLAAAQEELASIQNHIESAYLEQSFLGQMGHWIEPVVRPLGWDWRIGCAAIASFPAREVVVGTLGVIYSVGEADEESDSLRESLQEAKWPDGRPVFTIPVALSLMVFFALCAQCAATLAVMVRETNGYAWPAFTFLYMTGLAYVAALVTYQAGTWLAGA
jgi:ferrous iron transport protein B